MLCCSTNRPFVCSIAYFKCYVVRFVWMLVAAVVLVIVLRFKL